MRAQGNSNALGAVRIPAAPNDSRQLVRRRTDGAVQQLVVAIVQMLALRSVHHQTGQPPYSGPGTRLSTLP